MALIAMVSASGSPGVSTTALGMSLQWPRPVLFLEADPTGGSGLLSGYFRGTRPYTRGMIELALTASSMSDGLAEVVGRIENTDVSFVAGTRTHAQAPALRGLWSPLAQELLELESRGQDVIVDAGRLGMVASPEPLLAAADLVLLTLRTDLPSISAARSWADAAVRGDLDWPATALLLVGKGQPYAPREVSGVLGLPVASSIAWDPTAAAVIHRGAPPPKRFDTGPYVRSLGAAVAAVQAIVTRRHDDLAGTDTHGVGVTEGVVP